MPVIAPAPKIRISANHTNSDIHQFLKHIPISHLQTNRPSSPGFHRSRRHGWQWVIYLAAGVFLLTGLKMVTHRSPSSMDTLSDVRTFPPDHAVYQWAGFHRVAPAVAFS